MVITMKITFLGTAAAEGVPAVFCNCDRCKHAKAAGGKNIRTRSQILIDDDILFDFPMDTYMHMLRFGLDLSAVKTVLITHAHMDHCYPQEFCMRGGPFAHGMTAPTVKIYCDPSVRAVFEADVSREMTPAVMSGIELVTLHPFDTVEDGGVEIVALPAEHTKGEECLVYYLRRNGVGALLMNDTGILDRSVFERLGSGGYKINVAAFDCTYGVARHGAGRHMGLYDVADQIELISSVGLFAENAIKIATHFSHNGVLDYDEMASIAGELGILVAYDGKEVVIKN